MEQKVPAVGKFGASIMRQCRMPSTMVCAVVLARADSWRGREPDLIVEALVGRLAACCEARDLDACTCAHTPRNLRADFLQLAATEPVTVTSNPAGDIMSQQPTRGVILIKLYSAQYFQPLCSFINMNLDDTSILNNSSAIKSEFGRLCILGFHNLLLTHSKKFPKSV